MPFIRKPSCGAGAGLAFLFVYLLFLLLPSVANASSFLSTLNGPVRLDSPRVGIRGALPTGVEESNNAIFRSVRFERGQGESRDSSRARVFRWMIEDLGALPRAVWSPRFALYSATLLGGTIALASVDDDVSDQVGNMYTGTFRDILEVVDYVGGPKINLPVFAMAGASMITNNVKLQDAAFTSLQTLIYAGVLGYVLKGIFGRARPEWTDPYDPYAFFDRTGRNPLSHEGNSSYPSGHAIASFGIITPWVLYYPSVFTYAMYAIPTGTAVSRLAIDKHWATDLVVGAVIGISMGSWLTCRHRQPTAQPERLSFDVLNEGKLFALRFHLDR